MWQGGSGARDLAAGLFDVEREGVPVLGQASASDEGIGEGGRGV